MYKPTISTEEVEVGNIIMIKKKNIFKRDAEEFEIQNVTSKPLHWNTVCCVQGDYKMRQGGSRNLM